jgi:hypothetical protein
VPRQIACTVFAFGVLFVPTLHAQNAPDPIIQNNQNGDNNVTNNYYNGGPFPSDLKFPDVAVLDLDKGEHTIDENHYSGMWVGTGQGGADFQRYTVFSNRPYKLLYRLGYYRQIYRIEMELDRTQYINENMCRFDFQDLYPEACNTIAYMQTIYGPTNQIQLSVPDISNVLDHEYGDCHERTTKEKINGIKGDLKFEVVLTKRVASWIDRKQDYKAGRNQKCDVFVTWQVPYERK